MPRDELHKRIWLDPSKWIDSCVVIHAARDEQEFRLFDCHRSVVIHSYGSKPSDRGKFVKKLNKIRIALDDLIEFVESLDR
jgi:hypothetical protein